MAVILPFFAENENHFHIDARAGREKNGEFY